MKTVLLYSGKRLTPTTLPLITRIEHTAARVGRPRISESFAVFFFCRATAFGILNGLCKLGAILGNTIFASFVGITKVVPILLAAASLVGGGLVALRLPETREQVLMWTAPWGEEDGKIFFQDTSAQPHLLPLTVHRTPRTAQKEKWTVWSLV